MKLASILSMMGFLSFWTFSPDALVLLTNNAGYGTVPAISSILLASALFASCAAYLHPPVLVEKSPGPDKAVNVCCNSGPTVLISGMAAWLSTGILLPTGGLVSAGYTFNETFVYWFPNFGFSVLLLGLVTALHLAGPRVVYLSQIFFSTITGGCILFIILASLFSPALSKEIVWHSGTPSILPATAIAMLFFLGFEHQTSDAVTVSKNRLFQRPASIMGMGFILCLWTLAATYHVPSDKLMNSTIPHLIFAREAGGDAGRMLMGIAIISGSVLLTSGLFWQIEHFFTLNHFFFSPATLEKVVRSCKLSRTYPLFLASIIGGLMGAGLAGSEKLEFLIRGSLLLWLTSIAIQTLSRALTRDRYRPKLLLTGILLMTILLLAVVYQVAVHHDRSFILQFCATALGCSSLVFFITGRLGISERRKKK